MRSKGLIGVLGSLILALLVLGVAYAHWSETLYITTVVNTGDFCVEFWEDYCINYDEPGENDLKYYGYPDRWPFDVGETVCEVTKDTVTITLNNVYPCYQTWVRFVIKNCGTIPAKLKDVTVKFEDPHGLKDYVEFGVDIEIRDPDGNWVAESEYPGRYAGAFPTTDAPLDKLKYALETTIGDALDQIGGALPPGYELWLVPGFHIEQGTEENPTPESATLTIRITMIWTQFNDG